MLTVVILALIMSFTIIFSLRQAQIDTQFAYRKFNNVQAQFLAEGAMNIAKGDILSQVAATNFLSQNFNNMAARYNNLTNRFDLDDRRLPADTEDFDFKDPSIRNLAFWDFTNQTTAEGNPLIIGSNDWGAEGFDRVGDVRVYISQSSINSVQNTAQRSIGDYTFSITAVANVGRVQKVITNTYQHRLGAPTLFNFLMLGSNLSDCSICHIKLWGDVGQVDVEDTLQTEFDFNQWNGGKGRTSIYGSIFVNGDVERKSFQGNDPFERHLFDAGKKGEYDGWDVPERMQIWSRNGGGLANAWKTDNPTKDSAENPYKAIDPNFSPLPDSWPSAKDNMLNWFEPRAVSKAAADDAELRVEPRDNNLAATYISYNGARTTQVGVNSTNLEEQAIDRVIDPTLAMPTNYREDTSTSLYFYGLHPYDDFDGDGIPNALDADIDTNLETGVAAYPESTRGSDDPNDFAYNLTNAALNNSSNVFTDPVTGEKVFDLNGNSYVKDATTGAYLKNAQGYFIRTPEYYTNIESIISTDPTYLADVYRRDTTSSNVKYFWDAQLTGIATSMDNLLKNDFASTPTHTPGVIKGVFPNADIDSDGDPIYTSNDTRNLIVMGSRKNPINTKDQVVVRGDVVISGVVKSANDPITGEKIHGSIVTHRNIFIPTDLEYYDQPADWNDPQIDEGDQIGLVSGGNIIIGNYMQLSVWDAKKGEKTGKSQASRTGNNDPDNYYQGIMSFIWGNMVDTNDENLYTWYWGRDGSKDQKFNHMINPIYVMDGEDGGSWVNGQWVVENAGNTVNETFKGTNGNKMQIGGGLQKTLADGSPNPFFNEDRVHQNFYGNSYPSNPSLSNSAPGNKGANSYYKNYYVSTPGLLPLGSNRIPALPSGTLDGKYGEYSNNWFDSEDLQVITQKGKVQLIDPDNPSLGFKGALGAENNADSKWIKKVQAILYSDYGVIGGSLYRGPANKAKGNMLQFYGTVIGRDIQIMSATQNITDTEEKFTNAIGAFYYDKRLLQTSNPLGFPFQEGFEGGEMMTPSLPPLVAGTRDSWRPFRLTEEYYDFITKLEGSN